MLSKSNTHKLVIRFATTEITTKISTGKCCHETKKSVPIDLHDEEGRAIIRELVEDVDIFVENFRPGRLEEWNLGWGDLSEVNSDLVMVRITGFG